MQISASNLLIASQQAQIGAQQPKPAANFAAALKSDATAEAKPGFEALAFKKAETKEVSGPVPAEEPKPAGQTTRPGANLDIRI